MKLTDRITEFIFAEHPPAKADIIFVPGGSFPEPMERAAALWKEGFAPFILPSGRYSVKTDRFPGAKIKAELYRGPYPTECDFLTDVAEKNGVPGKAILAEKNATFTKENAFFSRAALQAQGIAVSRAILCCKAYHARRSLSYYEWAFPGVQFFVCPANVRGITRDNWMFSQAGISRVMGELTRLGSQLGEALCEQAAE